MIVARALPCLLLLVACRDSSSSGPPDSRPIDGAPADGAEGDGIVDGPPSDVMPTSVTRVWAVGDLLVNNTNIAGGFPADAQLPFSPATMTPIRVPGGTAVLATQTNNVFDARGTKIAYIADATVTGRFDLNVADADGSNPIVVVQGGTVNVEITSVALSPDGTKVAFTMDSAAVDGGLDLYVAATTAGATPILVSPSRGGAVAPALDVFPQPEWSRDSKYVAFAADLTEDGFDQVYVTDTSAVTPVAVEVVTRADITATTGARGVRGRVLFDAANNLYFRARLTDGQFAFYKSDVAGAEAAIPLPVRGDTSTPDAGAFGITPDGTKLVFSADAPTLGIYDVYIATTANLAAATKITTIAAIGNATLNAQFSGVFAFSPDGLKVAVTANFLSGGDNTFEPFVIALDGSTTTRLAAVPANTNQDTDVVVWADNATVFAQGDIVTSNDAALYKLDATMANQTPTPAVTAPTGGDIFNVFVARP
ncbi:MAG: hypothetical protein ACKV2T_43700 [Kofleriaceae bacterium]